MLTKELEKDTLDNDVAEKRKLILFNSNHLWDDVVVQLRRATGFDFVQCEQIAVIAHTKGKAVVKSGKYDELQNINYVLREISLVTQIE